MKQSLLWVQRWYKFYDRPERRFVQYCILPAQQEILSVKGLSYKNKETNQTDTYCVCDIPAELVAELFAVLYVQCGAIGESWSHPRCPLYPRVCHCTSLQELIGQLNIVWSYEQQVSHCIQTVCSRKEMRHVCHLRYAVIERTMWMLSDVAMLPKRSRSKQCQDKVCELFDVINTRED